MHSLASNGDYQATGAIGLGPFGEVELRGVLVRIARIAQRCLYGVDKNPMAIDLARLSLWVVTLARDHEFTFIDHALRHGDSLVGLSAQQIEGFHWDAGARGFQFGTETPDVRQRMAEVAESRDLIRECGDETPEHEPRELLADADRELANARRAAGLVLAAFSSSKRKEREDLRAAHAALLMAGDSAQVGAILAANLPLDAFHGVGVPGGESWHAVSQHLCRFFLPLPNGYEPIPYLNASQGCNQSAYDDFLRGGREPPMQLDEAVWVYPGRMSGVPCFRGTRLPVQHLFDWIEDGVSLDVFVDDFQVDRRAAIAVLRAGATAVGEAAARNPDCAAC